MNNKYYLLTLRKYRLLIREDPSCLDPSDNIIRLMALQLQKKSRIDTLPEIQQLQNEQIEPQFLVDEAKYLALRYKKKRDLILENKLLISAINSGGDPYFALLSCGMKNTIEKNFDDAIQKLSTLVKAYPGNDEPRIVLAAVFAGNKIYDEAIQTLSQIPQGKIERISKMLVTLEAKRMIGPAILILCILLILLFFKSILSIIIAIVFYILHFYMKDNNRFFFLLPIIDKLAIASLFAVIFYLLFLPVPK
jgi:hypothetical protein